MGALEYAPATAGFETSSSVQIDSLYQRKRSANSVY